MHLLYKCSFSWEYYSFKFEIYYVFLDISWNNKRKKKWQLIFIFISKYCPTSSWEQTLLFSHLLLIKKNKEVNEILSTINGGFTSLLTPNGVFHQTDRFKDDLFKIKQFKQMPLLRAISAFCNIPWNWRKLTRFIPVLSDRKDTSAFNCFSVVKIYRYSGLVSRDLKWPIKFTDTSGLMKKEKLSLKIESFWY